MTTDLIASTLVQEAYVDAACALHGLHLTTEQRQGVLFNFGLLAQTAAQFINDDIAVEIEQLPVYLPPTVGAHK